MEDGKMIRLYKARRLDNKRYHMILHIFTEIYFYHIPPKKNNRLHHHRPPDSKFDFKKNNDNLS